MKPQWAGLVAAACVAAVALGLAALCAVFTRRVIDRRLRLASKLNDSPRPKRTWTRRWKAPFKNGKAPLSARASIPIVGVLGVVAYLASGIVLSAATGLSGIALVTAMRKYAQHKAAERYEQALPVVLDEIARSLRSGAGLLTALTEAATTAPEVLRGDVLQVARRANLGDGVAEALRHWSGERTDPATRLCTAAMALALTTGGSQAQALDAASATVRQSLNAVSLAKSDAAQSRMSALVLTVLPLVVSGPVVATNDHAREFMLHSVPGAATLFAGIGLDALGAIWMSILIRRATS